MIHQINCYKFTIVVLLFSLFSSLFGYNLALLVHADSTASFGLSITTFALGLGTIMMIIFFSHLLKIKLGRK